MATQAHPRFAKIAPDPSRERQQLRIRYDPKDTACLPILAMLEQTEYGRIKQITVQALRYGAAASLGQETLSPPAARKPRLPGSARFVVSKRATTAAWDTDNLYTVYDPRQAWNRHIEEVFARCEWGQTNRTMLGLLVAGLRAMGYERPASAPPAAVDLQQDAAAAGRAEPAATATPPQPSRPQNQSITIGIDPTQAQPRPAPSGATSLLKGAGRRADQR